ncbi:patatin-like phospholipase family protein [Thiocystis violascens]|uniref:Putative esterase of the alpha-beta hydrolase superfamily n=1 Tax=Thiocystis violascens (strain ATCC 17096 / DSM 198 / 6111) TaxID=765911 RepID=I3YFH3_THIV6|nr:patatin-like phospholipase family protein [Thiocystis violascens]AFL75741.1 putative esterase of the alpha-beta hydrolase superfamily [Thiocystis violascens DSM 198]
MKRNLFALFATLLVALSLAVPADAREPQRPRIGLVLAGGGAKGSAHIGVLKVLEELRIPIHAIAGTSMGSLVGGVYAAGVPADELERRVTQVDWGALFDDNPPREAWAARRKETSFNPTWNFTVGVREGNLRLPKGAISGQKVQLFFNDLVKGVETVQDFDALPIPFRAVATNLENGEMVVFDRGPLPVAMRASMAVPGVFAPMEWEGRIYVDGGLVRNLPVDVARSMGVDTLIVVNLGSGFLPREQLGSILGVTGQMIAILTEQNVEASLKQIDPKRDVLIVPDLGDIGSGDFARAADAIATGVTAARKAAPRLARYRLSEAEYAAWKRARFGPGQPVQRVGEVRIAGLERVNAGVFDGLVENQAQQPFDRARLDAEIEKVYGRGDFERISYRFEPRRDGSDLLIVDAVEKAWGPGYLGFGLGLASDNQGDSRFGLRATYDQTWVNQLGAEWSTELTLGNAPSLHTELYQPLDLDRAAFVAPFLDYSQSPYSVFVGDQRVARYDVTRVRVGADAGTTLRGVELRIGPYVGQTEVALDTGSLELPEDRITDTGLHGRIVYDTLDSAGAPRSGTRIALESLSPLHALGADVDYTRALLSATTAHSFGANTITGRLRAGSSFGATMPYYDQFPLGGFLKLSGFANEQFRGNDMVFGALAYYRQIASLPPPIGRGLYLGASLEGGWLSDGVVQNPRTGEDVILSPEETRFGGSIFFGSDTWIGPAYLGLGLSETGDSTIYVLIGNP